MLHHTFKIRRVGCTISDRRLKQRAGEWVFGSTSILDFFVLFSLSRYVMRKPLLSKTQMLHRCDANEEDDVVMTHDGRLMEINV